VDFDRSALSQMQATAERYHENLLLSAEHLLYLEGRGISEWLARQFLLGVCDDVHEGWLSIPYLRGPGVVWFNYRRLDGGKPKYMASGSKHLFNTIDMDTSDTSGEIAVAEGELDTIIASAACDVPCVGIPGATQWTGNRPWHELFRGYQRVSILADPDEAGLGLAQAIMDVLPAARLVKLPGDVTETYLQHGDIKEFIK